MVGAPDAKHVLSFAARLRSERSGVEPWPGTFCCVLGQDTLLSQCLSLHTGVYMGTGEFNAGGNPVMD